MFGPHAASRFEPLPLPSSVAPARRRLRRVGGLLVAGVLAIGLAACGAAGPGTSSGSTSFGRGGGQLIEQLDASVSNPTAGAVRMTMHVSHGTGCGTTTSTIQLYSDGDCTGVPISIGSGLYLVPSEEYGTARDVSVSGDAACSAAGSAVVCTVPAQSTLRVTVAFPVGGTDTPSAELDIDRTVAVTGGGHGL